MILYINRDVKLVEKSQGKFTYTFICIYTKRKIGFRNDFLLNSSHVLFKK